VPAKTAAENGDCPLFFSYNEARLLARNYTDARVAAPLWSRFIV
jgi:hypothetical protein